MEDAFEFGDFGIGHGNEREAEVHGAEAAEVHGGFDRHGVDVHFEEGCEQLVIFLVHFARAEEIAFQRERDEFAHRSGNDIGGHADDAGAADGHERKGESVVAAEDIEIWSAGIHQLADAFGGAARLLHGDDIFAIGGEPRGGLHADLNATAARDAVKHDGQLRVVRDFFEMLVESLLAGLVVVGCNLQRCGGTGFLGGLREFDGFVRAVGSGAGDDFPAASGKFHGEFDDAVVFLVGERGALAGGAAGDDAGDAVVELEVDDFAQRGFIHTAVAKGGDDGGDDAGEFHDVIC